MNVTTFISWLLLQMSPIVPFEAFGLEVGAPSSMSTDHRAVTATAESDGDCDGERQAHDNSNSGDSDNPFANILVILISNGV